MHAVHAIPKKLALISAVVAAGASLLLMPQTAEACRVIQVEYTPGTDAQSAIWLEDADGNYIDTLQVTALTGTYGLGNRPGIMEFNSGYRWPYGRRVNALPVWAYKRNVEYPKVVFQDGRDDGLAHRMSQSSVEFFYCRPLRSHEDVDAVTCATTVYTDKGRFHERDTALYPPRNDIAERVAARDHEDVDTYQDVNDLDAVSQATPPIGFPVTVEYRVPEDLPNGRYRIRMEMHSEYDFNDHWSFPSPRGIDYGDYGSAHRGQPSVVYGVDFELNDDPTVAATREYEGYGSADGTDGLIRPPDETITMGTEGSGGERLLTEVDDAMGSYRVKVTALPRADTAAPNAPETLRVEVAESLSATLSFVAPDDEGGMVTRYDVRFSETAILDDENFETGKPAQLAWELEPVPAGQRITLQLLNLKPEHGYSVAVRAIDACQNVSPVSEVQFTTVKHDFARVSACFIATASYDSPMAGEINTLRRLRDEVLREYAVGRAFIGAYETLSPPVARFIAKHELLRATTRAGLQPIIRTVRTLMPPRQAPALPGEARP